MASGVTPHREEALSVHAILPGHSLYFGVTRFNDFCSAGKFAPVWVYIFRRAFFWHLACTLQEITCVVRGSKLLDAWPQGM